MGGFVGGLSLKRHRLFVGLVTLLVTSCSENGATVTRGAPPALSPGVVREILVGSPSPCESDRECASGLCRFSYCAGALSTDLPWVRRSIGNRLAKASGDDITRQQLVVEEIRATLSSGAVAGLGDMGLEGRAAALLTHLPGKPAHTLLVDLGGSTSPTTQNHVALALLERGDESMLANVAEQAASTDATTRSHAARALGGGESRESLHLLLVLIGDDNRFVRANAIRALARRDAPEAKETLEAAFDDLPGSEHGLLRHALTRPAHSRDE